RAFAGPMPGRRAMSSALAELRSMRAAWSGGAAPAATAPRPDRPSRSTQRIRIATTLTEVRISTTSFGASAAPHADPTNAIGVPAPEHGPRAVVAHGERQCGTSCRIPRARASLRATPVLSPPARADRRRLRGVAQPGRALRSGRRSRWFKSSHPDHSLRPVRRRAGRVNAVRRLSSRSLGGALLALAIGASIVAARTVVVKERARLRTGPSGTSDAVGWVSEGTQLEVLGESAGWFEVQAPEGHGYLWGAHTAAADVVERPPSAAPAPAPGSTVLDEVRALRDEVRALRERPEPVTSADLERLRAELERSLGSGREPTSRL